MATRTIDMKLQIDTKKGTASIKKLERATEKFGKDAKKSADKTTKAFKKTKAATDKLSKSIKGISFKSMVLGATAAATAFAVMTKASLDAADAIAKTADKLGLTTDALQQYRYAAELSGVKTTALDMGLQRFTRRLAEARQGMGELKGVLDQYNISVTRADGSSRSMDDVLDDLADTIANTTDEQERLRIAFKAFDSEGVALVNMLKNGSAGLDKFRKEAAALGIVLDEKLLRQSERANDALTRLSLILKTSLMATVADLAPDIEELANNFAEWYRANKDLIRIKVPEYLNKIKDAISSLYDFYKKLPAGTSIGILGTILFGPQAGIILGLIANMSAKIDQFKKDHPELFGGLGFQILFDEKSSKTAAGWLKKEEKEIENYRKMLEESRKANKLLNDIIDPFEGWGPSTEVGLAAENPLIQRSKENIAEMEKILKERSSQLSLYKKQYESYMELLNKADKPDEDKVKDDISHTAAIQNIITKQKELQNVLGGSGEAWRKMHEARAGVATGMEKAGADIELKNAEEAFKKIMDLRDKVKENAEENAKKIIALNEFMYNKEKENAITALNLNKKFREAEILQAQHAYDEQVKLYGENLQSYMEFELKKSEIATKYREQQIAEEANMWQQIGYGVQQSIEQAETWGETWIRVGTEVNEQLAGSLTSNLWAIIDGTKSAKQAAADFGLSMTKWLFEIILKQTILNALKQLYGTQATQTSALAIAGNTAETASVISLTAAYIALTAAKTASGAAGAASGGVGLIGSIPMMAEGGHIGARRTALVGERGPELFVPSKSGNIISNDDLAALGGGSQQPEINLNMANIVSPDLIDSYMASSRGKNAVLNVIGANARTVKRRIM